MRRRKSQFLISHLVDSESPQEMKSSRSWVLSRNSTSWSCRNLPSSLLPRRVTLTPELSKRGRFLLSSVQKMEVRDGNISFTKSTAEQWFKPKKDTNLTRFSGFKNMSLEYKLSTCLLKRLKTFCFSQQHQILIPGCPKTANSTQLLYTTENFHEPTTRNQVYRTECWKHFPPS